MIRAALFDLGGVIVSSPFEAFNRYEEQHGLPRDFLRSVNATNPHTNAWACFERNEIDAAEFCRRFEQEALAAGHAVQAHDVLALLAGEVRPAMVAALRRCKDRLKTACLTNNVVSVNGAGRRSAIDGVLSLFDCVVESSKVGVRKPEPRFYEIACELLGIAPHEAVFLDDLGVNLKPARAMGMTTIKVVDAEQAIADLEAVVGFPLR